MKINAVIHFLTGTHSLNSINHWQNEKKREISIEWAKFISNENLINFAGPCRKGLRLAGGRGECGLYSYFFLQLDGVYNEIFAQSLKMT